MKINLKNEYFLVVGLSLLLLIIVCFSNLSIMRTILGLPFLLFLPGYLLTTVMFPKADDLEDLERLVLGVGLSIIIVPLIGLLHNYLLWGIRLVPMVFSIILLNTILAVLGWYRRKKVPEEKRFVLTFKVNFIKPLEQIKEAKFVHIALGITILVLFVTIFYIVFSPETGDSFTEFYITGQDGVASGYPEQLQVGENGVVRAGVLNHEHQKTIYTIEVRVDSDLVQTITPISLERLEKWEEKVLFKAKKPKDAVKVEFLLFKGAQNTIPYRQLKLWVQFLPPNKS